MKRMVIRVAWMWLPVAALVLAEAAQVPVPKKPTLDQYGPLNWVDPNRNVPAGTQYKTFHSVTINADVSYVIYLPPDYEGQKTTRYPSSTSCPAAGARLAPERRWQIGRIRPFAPIAHRRLSRFLSTDWPATPCTAIRRMENIPSKP